MVTTINAYSVSLGLDARSFIDSAQLSRRETNMLVKDIEAARTPAERFAHDHNLLTEALRKGSIELGTYNRLLQAKKEQYGFADVALKDYASSLTSVLTIGLGAVTGATLAATAAGVAFISHIKSTQDAIDDVADSANKLGISYNELTGLRFAGQEGGGLDAATVDASIKKMMINISKAASDPDNKVNEVFRRLGVTAGELLKAGPTEAVMKIADGMQGMNSQADKLALSMEVFGKAGTEMVSTLSGGRDAIAEAVDFQNKWNGLTDAQVVAVGASNDAWDRISVIIDGVSTKLAAEFAPAFLLVAESVLNAAGGVKNIDENMQFVVNTTAYYLGLLKDVTELFVAMPMALAGMDTSFAFDLSSGQKAMQAVIDERAKLENAAIGKAEERRLQQERLVAEEMEAGQTKAQKAASAKAYTDMMDRVIAEENKRIESENRIARSAIKAADDKFKADREKAIKLRDEIAKGPGGGIQADSNEAAKFMADQVNKALASDSVGVPGKPTDEQLLDEAARQRELAEMAAARDEKMLVALEKMAAKPTELARAR